MSETFGPGIRLKSIMFSESVRFPGSSMTGHYIPAEDYPLTYYPQAQLVVARMKTGVRPLPNFTAVNVYAWARVRDAQVFDDAMPVETSVVERNGLLTVPETRMRQKPDGSFERITDEELAAATATPAPASANATAKRGGGWPKGKPRKRAASEAPAPPPAPAAAPPRPRLPPVSNGPG